MFLTILLMCGAGDLPAPKFLPTPRFSSLPAPKFAAVQGVISHPVRAGYPLRSSWWTHPGEVHAHLLVGEHAGKFDPTWLMSLSNAEAEALHSDDHEGRLKTEYVKRSAVQAAPLYYIVPKR